MDPASVLEQIELEVSKVKEEAFSRKEVLEKVEKWLSAREEEEWLEQYNQVMLIILKYVQVHSHASNKKIHCNDKSFCVFHFRMTTDTMPAEVLISP